MAELLAKILLRHATGDGVMATAIPRLHLIRSSTPTEPIHVLHQPAVCWVAQGRKQTMLGDEVVAYGPGQFLVVSAELPLTGQILEASPAQPYLCLRLDLDPVILDSIVEQANLSRAPGDRPERGVAVCPVPMSMQDAVERLAALLDAAPAERCVLAPLVERELAYRLLASDAGHQLRQIACRDSKLARITRAIAWIKLNYARALRVDDMAALANMSPSTFHEHFRTVTAMSPLQYLKQIRLQEARRLMLAQAFDAATAGFHVGYESASQFSREYTRCFGLPPRRDIIKMRAAITLTPSFP